MKQNLHVHKTLYEITGDIKDFNTLLINRNNLAELLVAQEALHDAYRMLAESLDTSLMLSEKLTNAQARWLGRENGKTI